jgi:F-type H+-transporting ATPase subunit b
MLDFSVTFFITLINLAVLFVIMRALLFKPVRKFMQSRTDAVQSKLDAAETDRASAKKLLDDYTARLSGSEAEAAKIIADARDAAGKEADRITGEAHSQAALILASAQKQIEADRAAALAVFRSEAAALVVLAAGKLLKRDMQTEDYRQQAAALLAELG